MGVFTNDKIFSGAALVMTGLLNSKTVHKRHLFLCRDDFVGVEDYSGDDEICDGESAHSYTRYSSLYIFSTRKKALRSR